MSGVVTVEIGGQRYPIRSGLDPAYVGELAAYVDKKMRAASDAAPTTAEPGGLIPDLLEALGGEMEAEVMDAGTSPA